MDLGTVVTALGICVVLPLVIVGLIVYMKNHEVNKRSEILLAAIEKNTNINIDEFFKQQSSQQGTLKERVLKKLTSGLLFTAVGFGCLCFSAWLIYQGQTQDAKPLLFCGFIPLFVGIAYIISFFICKKELAKEIEQEETETHKETIKQPLLEEKQ